MGKAAELGGCLVGCVVLFLFVFYCGPICISCFVLLGKQQACDTALWLLSGQEVVHMFALLKIQFSTLTEQINT